MPDIMHDFRIHAPIERVFAGVSLPAGLDAWWTLACSGEPRVGASYALEFGPDCRWAARVAACEPPRRFELELVEADADWTGTRVRVELARRDGVTKVRFAHLGWREVNEQYRATCFCWAQHLRLLRRLAESGERIPGLARDVA